MNNRAFRLAGARLLAAASLVTLAACESSPQPDTSLMTPLEAAPVLLDEWEGKLPLSQRNITGQFRKTHEARLAAVTADSDGDFSVERAVSFPPRNFQKCIIGKPTRQQRLKATSPVDSATGTTTARVDFRFSVLPNGRLTDIRVIGSTSECLIPSATASLENWLYYPAREAGVPVRTDGVETEIEYSMSSQAVWRP